MTGQLGGPETIGSAGQKTSGNGKDNGRKNEHHGATDAFNRLHLGTDLASFLDIRYKMPDYMMTPTANNLARGDAIDLVVSEAGKKHRFLVYPKTEGDATIYQQLLKARVPHLRRIESRNNPALAAVVVPEAAYRLDSIDYSEQETDLGYTGAVELMDKLGTVLNHAGAVTGELPVNFRICTTAFTGGRDFIKLIPPYEFSKDVTREEILQRVGDQLRILDPNHPHETQIEAFTKAFLNII